MNSAVNYLCIGISKYNRGEYAEALSDFGAAIQLKPDYASAHFFWGCAIRHTTRSALLKAAIKSYSTAIRLKPNFFQAYYNRGEIRAELGEHRAAIKDFDTATQLKPDRAFIYFLRGQSNKTLGDCYGQTFFLNAPFPLWKKKIRRYYTAAIKDFDAAIHLKPDFFPFYYHRAFANVKLGQYDAAIKDFDAAIHLKPGSLNYHRAFANVKLGQYDAAMADIEAMGIGKENIKELKNEMRSGRWGMWQPQWWR